MNLETAQGIARGYMAPNSDSINWFAQHGTLRETLEYREGDSDTTPKEDLLAELMDEVRLQQSHKHSLIGSTYPHWHAATVECDNNMAELLRLCDFIDTL